MRVRALGRTDARASVRGFCEVGGETPILLSYCLEMLGTPCPCGSQLDSRNFLLSSAAWRARRITYDRQEHEPAPLAHAIIGVEGLDLHW